MTDDHLIEAMAKAIREEIVRQYRDDERQKCPAGACYYEEHIGPEYIARIALATARAQWEQRIRDEIERRDHAYGVGLQAHGDFNQGFAAALTWVLDEPKPTKETTDE